MSFCFFLTNFNIIIYMNTNVLINNLTLLATNSPQDLRVDADGVTLRRGESKSATSAKDVSQIVKQMREYAEKVTHPIFIKLAEKVTGGKTTEILGLKPEQIFDRILRPDSAPLTENDWEKHKTISITIQDDKGERVFECDRELLCEHLTYFRDAMSEWGIASLETKFEGFKSETFSKMLEFLNGSELDETDPIKLQEFFDLASQMGYTALMDHVAAKLAPIMKQADQTKLLISLAPELLDRAVTFLERQDAKQWLAAINKAIPEIDQLLEKIVEELKTNTDEEKKRDLEYESHRLKEAKLHLKRSMINLINEKQVPFNELLPGIVKEDEIKERVQQIQSIINLNPEGLRYADLRFEDVSTEGTGLQLNDAEFESLVKSCHQLTHLFVSSVKLTDAALAHLQGMPLTCANFRDCIELTDAGLAHFKGMALKSVDFGFCMNLTDACLAHFIGMPLDTIDFSFCWRLTDAGLAHFKGMKLKIIKIEGCRPVTEAGLIHFKGMPLEQPIFLNYKYYTKEYIDNLSLAA